MTGARREPLFTPPFLRLLAFNFLAFLAGFQLFPTMPFHLLDLGSGRAAAGLFLTVYTWASALSAPLTGAFADRFGRRRTLLLAAIAFAGLSLLYGVAGSLPALLALGIVHGVFWSGMLSAGGALVIDATPASRRTEALGWAGIAPTAAIAVAPAVGLAVYRLGWRTLTLELCGLAVLLALLALRVRENPAPAATAAVARPAAGAGVASRRAPGFLLRRLAARAGWRVMAVASTIFLVALGYGGVNSYAALLAVERGIQPASLFFTGFALTIVASRLLTAPIADRRGPLVLLVPALLLAPLGFVLLAAARSPAQLVTAAVVFGLGFGNAYPAFMSWVLARTDPARRAATFGAVLLSLDTAIGTGSLLVGRIGERLGLGTGFLAAGGAAALALPAFLLTRRLLPEPEAAAGRSDGA